MSGPSQAEAERCRVVEDVLRPEGIKGTSNRGPCHPRPEQYSGGNRPKRGRRAALIVAADLLVEYGTAI